jgi:glucokinase
VRAATAPADVTATVAGNMTTLFDRSAPASLGELGAALDASLVAALRFGDVSGLGITVPGLVMGTTCRWVPNLPYLDGVDLRELNARVVGVGNDAHLALLAEATEGAARRRQDALLLAIGTGIGSAVLAGGRIQPGASGAACSFGWACADREDAGEDRRGWLERQAAGPALDALGARMRPPVDGAGLVAAARRGDMAASEVVRSVAVALGTTLAGAVALLDPGVVIVSGGVADAFDVLASPLREAMTHHVPPHLRHTEIRRGELGPQASLVGALIAARRGADFASVR